MGFTFKNLKKNFFFYKASEGIHDVYSIYLKFSLRKDIFNCLWSMFLKMNLGLRVQDGIFKAIVQAIINICNN